MISNTPTPAHSPLWTHRGLTPFFSIYVQNEYDSCLAMEKVNPHFSLFPINLKHAACTFLTAGHTHPSLGWCAINRYLVSLPRQSVDLQGIQAPHNSLAMSLFIVLRFMRLIPKGKSRAQWASWRGKSQIAHMQIEPTASPLSFLSGCWSSRKENESQ